MNSEYFKNRVFCKFCSDEIIWEKKTNEHGATYWNPLNKKDRTDHRCRQQIWDSSLQFKEEFGIEVAMEDKLLPYWYIDINALCDLLLGRRVYLEKDYKGRKLFIVLKKVK